MKRNELTPLFRAALEAVEFGEAIAKSLEDGKIQVPEALGLLWETKDLFYIYNNFQQIREEFMSMDDSTADELQRFIAAEFDIKNDIAELRIKKGFNIVFSTIEFAKTFK